MSFQKIIIPNQKDIFRFKTNLFFYGLKYNSKKQYYYNPYELETSQKTMLLDFLNSQSYDYKITELENLDFMEEIEFVYRLEGVDSYNFFIEKRKTRKKEFYVNLTSNTLNILDLNLNKHLSTSLDIKDYEEINLPMFTLRALNAVQNDFNELNKILSALIEYNSSEFKFESRLNSFKYHIFGIIKEKNQDNFLCNCVDGFFYETNFYVNGNRIYSDYLKDNISFEQEKKILKYLFLNKKYIGIKKEPSYKDLFLGKKIIVQDANRNEHKVVINKIDSFEGFLKIKVFNGKNYFQISRTFTKESLAELVAHSR